MQSQIYRICTSTSSSQKYLTAMSINVVKNLFIILIMIVLQLIIGAGKRTSNTHNNTTQHIKYSSAWQVNLEKSYI